METKEKSFEELIKEASLIADRRRTVFTALLERISNEYIPALCTVMKGFDISRCYFRLENKPREKFDKQTSYECDEFYGLCIYNDGDIIEAYYDESRGKWHDCQGACYYEKDDYGFKNGCAIELAVLIKKRIALLNEKYSEINDKASSILDNSGLENNGENR